MADRDRRDHDHPAAGHHSTKPGSATQPFPGVAAEVRDESTGEPIQEGQGLLVLTQPWPSMLRTLYKEEERYINAYFSRFGRETYLVGDAARRDKDGYLWVIGRIDDVVNVSGHRLSTAEVESAIVAHPDVAEAAVIGQHDEDTGQAIVAFVTLQGELEGDEATIEGIRATVAERIGKFARPASSGRMNCPRRARARSCAGCCATSPRGAPWAMSRLCATRRSWPSSKPASPS